MRISILAMMFFSFASVSSFAAPPVITGATGVAAIDLTGTIEIFGGFAGVDPNCTAQPCNSCVQATNTCATAPLCNCNPTRNFDGEMITISVTHADAGELVLANADNSLLTIDNAGNTGGTLQITWGSLCNQVMGGTSGCDGGALTPSTITLNLFVDKGRDGQVTGDEGVPVKFTVLAPAATTHNIFGTGSNEGVGDFSPYPGDEKVFIEDPATATNFPTLSYSTGAKVSRIRVFVSNTNIAAAHPEAAVLTADLDIDEEGNNIVDSVVDGLENNVPYVFRIASVDQAGNVVQFYPSDAVLTTLGLTAACATNPPDPATCPFAARPDEVLGLLTDDVNCFIATAAFGSSFEPELDTLRAFRFKVLSKYQWGIDFIRKYYKYGPFAARYIHDKPALRAITRAALWPFVGFSKLALKFGLWPALAISLTLLASLIALPLYGVRRRAARA